MKIIDAHIHPDWHGDDLEKSLANKTGDSDETLDRLEKTARKL